MDAKTVKGLIKGALGAVRDAFKGTVHGSDVSSVHQILQVEGLSDEALPDVEFLQAFGLASRPLEGLQCVVLPLGGKTAHAVVLGVQGDRASVAKLLPGESIVYSSGGAFVHVRADGSVVVEAKVVNVSASKVNIKSDVEITGGLKVNGAVQASGNVASAGQLSDAKGSMQAVRDKYNEHTHQGADGVTQPPSQRM